LTLLGFFVQVEALQVIQWVLVRWAVIIVAFSGLLGVINVLTVHVGKLTTRAPGWFYSLALILSAVAVLVIGIGESLFPLEEGLGEPLLAPVFEWIIAPLQAAAAGLLVFILTYAAYRMLRLKRRASVFVFLLSASVILVSHVRLSGWGTGLQNLRDIWLSWLAVPGLRAVLIGVALGVTMMALRLIMGIDRPQS
jgi:hypothetical protein